jgi:putative polyketide hydroxylase
MELGQLYRSSEVIGAGQDLPHARTPEAWAGQPGVRALMHGSFTRVKPSPPLTCLREVSSYFPAILPGANLPRMLLTGFGVSTRAVIVGEDVLFRNAGEFERLFGVQSGGASLVRPDGVVCWRTEPTLRLGVCSQVQQSVVPWRSRRTESVGKNPSRD